jgi:hypothetical protein
MALVLADRVQETSTSSGTGTFTLGGAVSGYQSFATGIGSGNTVYYTIYDSTSFDWEVGLGTFTAPSTLARTTVYANSLGTTAFISFAGNTTSVFATYPGGKAVSTDTLATPPAIGGTTPAAGTFTTLSSTGTATFGTGSSAYWSAIGGSAPNLRSTAGGTIDIGGANNLSIRTNTTTEQLRVTNTTSAVNYQTITGSATNFAPIHSVAGSDANISLAFQPKGTGAIDLAAGSSGVNISNGGTVTAITRTAIGSGYTSAPTWSASAPTTAGGTTASGTTTLGVATQAVSAGGTGYTVNDVLTFVGGTGTAATATVTTATTVTTPIAIAIARKCRSCLRYASG